MAAELLIKEGKNTPAVNGDPSKGRLTFEGNSFPENVKYFYDPIMIWLDETKGHCGSLHIESQFYYMASSSVIAFLRMLKKAEELFSANNVTMRWCYEEGDDDIKKIGEDFSKLLDINFEFQEVQEEV